MDIKLFAKIAKSLGDTQLDDFLYTHEGITYGFNELKPGNWIDEGKFQQNEEEGQLVSLDKGYKIIQTFNFGVSREVSRFGSYHTDWDYQYTPYKFFSIEETLIPEKIIPEHTERKWVNLGRIDLTEI